MRNQKRSKTAKINSFDLHPGFEIARKYRVISKLGSGWEGEVYKVAETRTGIEKAAKLFFPHRNIGNRTSKRYAKKLHKLRQCHILIQYHAEETLLYRRVPITVLISEYVEGILLSEFLKNLPGKRLRAFDALHLLYSLTKGMEEIHLQNEYHGDLHLENIIVGRYGLMFEPKILDLFHWEAPRSENRQSDICDLVKIFYETLGGARYYAKQPYAVKYICSGLKRSLILKKFRTMSQFRKYLETMKW